MLFFWHPATSKKKGGGGAQADERLLSSAKHWYVLGEAESHLRHHDSHIMKVIMIATHYQDDSAVNVLKKPFVLTVLA